jgi:hypothetical protein
MLVLVACAGAGTMAVELSAVRILAPWFGTSTGVWSNVIGVVLLALALGYYLGGTLARASAPGLQLARVLLLAALGAALTPFLAAPVAGLFLPSDLTLEQLTPLLHWGSLATSLLLFLPTALALGCVCPLALEIICRAGGGSAGNAGGRILAWSTLGGLVGTFATTHLAVPNLGLRLTLLLAAAILGLPGLLLYLVRNGPRREPALFIVALPLLALAPVRLGNAPPAGWEVLEERLSALQNLRVVKRADTDLRLLQVNEGLDSFQSVWQPQAGLLPTGYYYNYFAAPAWWSRARGQWNVLLLGAGAGTAARVISGCLPQGATAAFVGVELDPVVLELGRRWFDLDSPAQATDSMEAVVGDARAALQALGREGRRFDQIVLDAYANQSEIPAHLTSLEFFREARDCLGENGWMMANVGAFGLADPLVEAVGHTLATAFQRPVLALRVPFARNVILVARPQDQAPEPGSESWPVRALAEILGPLEVPGTWRWLDPLDEAPLTDDRSPTEMLQARSLELGWQL